MKKQQLQVQSTVRVVTVKEVLQEPLKFKQIATGTYRKTNGDGSFITIGLSQTVVYSSTQLMVGNN